MSTISKKNLSDPINTKIYTIIRYFYEKKKIFSFDEFYERCSKKLELSDSEIFDAFNTLVEQNMVIEGSRLIKDELLKNETRFKLFRYINENPGSHFTKIISSLGLGPHAGRYHIEVLGKFGCIRSKQINRYSIYFDMKFPENRDEMIFLLRNENANKIYGILIANPNIIASQIDKNMDIHYNTVKYYLKKLVAAQLINEFQENKRKTYSVNEGHLVFLERFFTFESKKLPRLPITTPITPVSTGAPQAAPVSSPVGGVKAIREFDYVGGDIRFKVAVQNNSNHTVSKINVMLTSTEQYLVDQKVKSVSVLAPNESRGVDFTLTPLTCGKSRIFATISYSDSGGNPQSLTVKPKDIWIKCPLVTPKHASLGEVLSWKKELLNGTSSIEYVNIPDSQAFKIALDQISALDLSEIDMNEQQKSALYSGIAKVTNDKMIIELNILNQKINVNVWTSELKQATGFLAYIKNLIKMSLENAQQFQVKAERVGQKILDSFDISERINDLFGYCDESSNINDLLIVLGEIGARLKRSFPDIAHVDSIETWRENIEANFRAGDNLPESLSLKLQGETLSWISKIVDLAKSNAEIYETTFSDQDIPISKIKSRINDLVEQIFKNEIKYSQNILKYLMVIHKDSGLTIYQKGFFGTEFDPDLVGGFLTAIQSFGSEIHTSETSMKKLVYKDFQIELEVGDYVRAALVLNGKPTNHLLMKLLKFVNEFEKMFAQELDGWTGNIQVFREKGQALEKIFLEES